MQVQHNAEMQQSQNAAISEMQQLQKCNHHSSLQSQNATIAEMHSSFIMQSQKCSNRRNALIIHHCNRRNATIAEMQSSFIIAIAKMQYNTTFITHQHKYTTPPAPPRTHSQGRTVCTLRLIFQSITYNSINRVHTHNSINPLWLTRQHRHYTLPAALPRTSSHAVLYAHNDICSNASISACTSPSSRDLSFNLDVHTLLLLLSAKTSTNKPVPAPNLRTRPDTTTLATRNLTKSCSIAITALDLQPIL